MIRNNERLLDVVETCLLIAKGAPIAGERKTVAAIEFMLRGALAEPSRTTAERKT